MSTVWQPPKYERHEFFPKRTRYCFIVVVWNEGDRIRNQLVRMQKQADLADIIVADGRSTDNSTDPSFLCTMGVRTLLSTDERGLSTATRMALAYAMEQNYEGVITVDGNGKDGIEALPDFIQALDENYDLVQGSRFMKGGVHKNTPLYRYIGVQYIMAPILALGCGYWYTDPTNAFRAMSMRFLKDKRVQPIRNIFVRFNLQQYVNYRAATLNMKIKEIPVARIYPEDGTIPTKIIGFRSQYRVVHEMIICALGGYNPK